MPRSIQNSIITLIVAVILPTAYVEAAELSDLNGQWRAAETAEEASKRRQAIADVARAFPMFARGNAESQLSQRTAPAASLDLSIEGNVVKLVRDGQATLMELGGAPKVTQVDGKEVRLAAREEGGNLVIVSEGSEGSRTVTYRLIDGSHMRLSIRMSGGKLRNPLDYEQTYTK